MEVKLSLYKKAPAEKYHTFSQKWYLLAKAYYSARFKPPHCFNIQMFHSKDQKTHVHYLSLLSHKPQKIKVSLKADKRFQYLWFQRIDTNWFSTASKHANPSILWLYCFFSNTICFIRLFVASKSIFVANDLIVLF